jgi:hypothetical protein
MVLISGIIKHHYGWEREEIMARIVLSRSVIVTIAVLVSVALVATVLFFYLGNGDDGGNGDDDTWQEGDFVEWGYYYYEAGGEPLDPTGFQRYTVVDVGAQWLTINHTQYDMARDVLFTQEMHLAVNSTGFGFSATSLEYLGYDVTDLGLDTVETEWGELSAEHYRYTYAYGETNYTVDVWTRGGFFVMQKTTAATGLQLMILLVDTNISSIYS